MKREREKRERERREKEILGHKEPVKNRHKESKRKRDRDKYI